MFIDHADIVVTHKCNMNCPNCIDPLRIFDKSKVYENPIVSLENIENFLKILKKHTDSCEVLLLGGEPTMVGYNYLCEIAKLVKSYGFDITMSTNGSKKEHILGSIIYFDSVQITAHSQKEIDYWANIGSKVNLKIAGDKYFTIEKLEQFIEYTENKFYRRSVSMYFTPDFQELCEDDKVWKLYESLDWQRNGSYLYTFYKGVRIKKCLPGLTNIIDEESVPKLYPNGNYNKTWLNEKHDPYLG